MLLLLPILTFVVTFLTILGTQDKGEKPLSVRLSFLQAALVTGAFVALSSELLSLLEMLTTAGTAAAWSLALIVVMGICWRKNALHPGWKRVWRSIKSIGKTEVVFLAGLSVILLALLVIALRSPSSNTDSLLYHMSRAAHWEQNKSLQHYPTAYEPQLMNPVFAELGILHLGLLTNSDRLANLVQWFSMIGSLIAVSAAAQLLGAKRWGQLAALTFAASLPMGILQSTSTQNDWVVSFWLITLACFIIFAWKNGSNLEIAGTIGLAAGLGMLTKGTFYPFAVPFAAWLVMEYLRRFNLKKILLEGMLIAAVIFLINAGFWIRNLQTYGTPLGSTEFVTAHATSGSGAVDVLRKPVQNYLMNFTTPYESWNNGLAKIMHFVFQLNKKGSEIEFLWAWNHEDLAGNPLHYILVPVSIFLTLIIRRRNTQPALYWYSIVSLFVFFVFSLIVLVGPFNNRLQLPFLVVWAPIFGAAVSLIRIRLAQAAVVFLLLILALPWVLFNRTRPLIAMRNNEDPLTIPCDWHFGCTATGSVLLEQPSVLVFANWMQYRKPYLSAGDYVLSSGCKDVGLRIDSHDLEYLFWWMLDSPDSGIRIESLYYAEELEQYADPGFQPCIILCTICSEREILHNLDRVASFGEIQVYGGSNFHPLADSE